MPVPKKAKELTKARLARAIAGSGSLTLVIRKKGTVPAGLTTTNHEIPTKTWDNTIKSSMESATTLP